ncbi:hypothetical protein BDZ89DRAFT_1156254 [Hymenopellis radicata]|nr:hypothetical protein BDZ89DRAFT_1156254 [Hymenopellis radicata]
MSAVEKLKTEGNALFLKKEYNSAITKYTKAIALDEKNVILYANRSACQRSLKKYTEALADAITATQLDPTYSKAWGKVGDAYYLLAGYINSINAYKTALGTLPKENLSPAEAKQKSQYEDGMKLAQETFDRTHILTPEANPSVTYFNPMTDKAPWIVAREMITDLVRDNYADSSAWTLSNAYREFSVGVQIMRSPKVRNNQGVAILGAMGALQNLTNSLISDERVFHLDSPNWPQLFEDQMTVEEFHCKPWPVHVSPSQIMAQAPERVQKEGWRPVRMAITMNVRYWIMKGFVDGMIADHPAQKLEKFRNAITVLRWGAAIWKDIPREDRGAIFQTTFINGVRRLYLDAIMDVRAHASTSTEDRQAMLSLLNSEARDLIKDIDAGDTSQESIGSLWAYHKNCWGHAHAALGYYHVQQLSHATSASEHENHLRTAGNFYLKAADGYATDDQSHTWYLHRALEYMIKTDAAASEQLQVVKRLKVALPKMKKLWWAGPRLVDKEKEKNYDADLALEPFLEMSA